MSSPMSPSRWLRPFKRDRDPSKLDLDEPSSFSSSPRPHLLLKSRSHSTSRQNEPPIFGSDITVSTGLAHGTVLISTDTTSESNSQPVVYGNIPLVIVSCGSYLKRNALETEGIFRVGGSSKRLKQLQTLFSTPPDYGANIDWTGYTVHDAASLLRRYLTALPEPLIPLDLYYRFREAMLEKTHLVTYLKEKELKMGEDGSKKVVRQLGKEDKRIILNERRSLLNYYAQLFDEIKPIQRRTLFYILDLLALFHLNSKTNRMSAKNLSYIFQPSIIFHPDHELSPDEYAISGLVLEFCITYSYKILAKVQEQAVVDINKNQLSLPITPTTPTALSSDDPPQPLSRPHSKSLSHMDNTSHVCEPPKILSIPQPHREPSIITMTSIDMSLAQSVEARADTEAGEGESEEDNENEKGTREEGLKTIASEMTMANKAQDSTDSLAFSIQSSRLEGHIDEE